MPVAKNAETCFWAKKCFRKIIPFFWMTPEKSGRSRVKVCRAAWKPCNWPALGMMIMLCAFAFPHHLLGPWLGWQLLNSVAVLCVNPIVIESKCGNVGHVDLHNSCRTGRPVPISVMCHALCPHTYLHDSIYMLIDHNFLLRITTVFENVTFGNSMAKLNGTLCQADCVVQEDFKT